MAQFDDLQVLSHIQERVTGNGSSWMEAPCEAADTPVKASNFLGEQP